ncbi:3-oxoacyl-[acyl-carrier-protein] synthase III C-terminal domain-containing protein [Kitasatospora cineracea]|uniref:3-oxoacyl-[acyl-carrier-protein] synthase-3 n=1 Tax=Kitasatospora cineracea TaxID=88074 RepID=A0A3N4R7K3_9ACTN|nr:3-oxoacyl-[acyl-carrier-protein] synthase III C-terminal domain-containing protein [Kitasatospora cineracea]ROR37371.1 3-oxoacyl-[acyl-carrier-protein] synthase-3 [Kitasatospora cineracea]RPE29172.1 3-oxoacyl-[acyl-carrier-protein] synthase-3 [Kitasatospora cineracea]
MTALEAVAVHLPPVAEPIELVGERLGLTGRQISLFRRFHGLDQVRVDPDGDLTDLLTAAAKALAPLRGNEHRVKYVLHARSLPIAAPYPHNPLHDALGRLGLTHARALTITHHACAGSLLALDVAGRLLAADPDPAATALILAGEKTFTRDARIVPDTALFGEGAAACLVRAGGERDRVLSYAVDQHGEFDGRLAEDPELMLEYQRSYPELMTAVMEAALEEAGESWDSIRLLLPHNVNQISWKRICRRTGYPPDRVVLDNVPAVGHSFAADILLNHHTATTRGLLRRGDRYLVAASGIGATFAAMVLQH